MKKFYPTILIMEDAKKYFDEIGVLHEEYKDEEFNFSLIDNIAKNMGILHTMELVISKDIKFDPQSKEGFNFLKEKEINAFVMRGSGKIHFTRKNERKLTIMFKNSSTDIQSDLLKIENKLKELYATEKGQEFCVPEIKIER
ncbi:MAG: hypothetical protein WA101_02030 [Minisyncoccia bacterium]